MYLVSSLQVSALPMTEYCKSQYEHRKQNSFQWRFLCFVMIKSKKVENWQSPYFLFNIGLKKCPGFQNMNSNQTFQKTFSQYLIKSRGNCKEVSFLTLYTTLQMFCMLFLQSYVCQPNPQTTLSNFNSLKPVIQKRQCNAVFTVFQKGFLHVFMCNF